MFDIIIRSRAQCLLHSLVDDYAYIAGKLSSPNSE